MVNFLQTVFAHRAAPLAFILYHVHSVIGCITRSRGGGISNAAANHHGSILFVVIHVLDVSTPVQYAFFGYAMSQLQCKRLDQQIVHQGWILHMPSFGINVHGDSGGGFC